MWIRCILTLAALVLASSSFAQEQRGERAAQLDHRVCLDQGYKARSAEYAACRRELAGRRQARQQEEAEVRLRDEWEARCARGAAGMVTPYGGSIAILCPTGRYFPCPGNPLCPVCPGSIHCLPR